MGKPWENKIVRPHSHMTGKSEFTTSRAEMKKKYFFKTIQWKVKVKLQWWIWPIQKEMKFLKVIKSSFSIVKVHTVTVRRHSVEFYKRASSHIIICTDRNIFMSTCGAVMEEHHCVFKCSIAGEEHSASKLSPITNKQYEWKWGEKLKAK